MENLSININLFKLKSAGLVNLTGSSGTVKRGVFIPIDDNHLIVGEKGVYLNLVAFASDKLSGQTHLIKPSYPKNLRESMTKEELYAIPIVGGIQKPREVTPEGGQSYTPFQQTSTGNPTEVVAPATCPDDLPF